ncbi:hypothetical protein B0H14DRAFT_3428822 [Mycena olivaceomarginata]|nr:hypothetical protein B0H14DRAFT_3428822 [Mycena olivaceomarginata]
MLNVDIASMQDRAERRRALGRGFEPLLRGIGTAWVGVQLESSHLLCLGLRFGVRPPRLRACVGRSWRVAGGASTFLSAPNSFVGISMITYRMDGFLFPCHASSFIDYRPGVAYGCIQIPAHSVMDTGSPTPPQFLESSRRDAARSLSKYAAR